ncbi:MAG: hypothetical protein HY315_07900 [Acidobacteria bacterium]|nr:hypothetical protein [Acidobacteriota bacterium]
MAHPQIAAFARLAEGGKAPVRRIEGQETLLGRASHAIVYDEIHDEIVVPQGFAQAILTFRGAANGQERPIRVIHGSRTQLKDPDPLAVDPVNNEIFVPEDNRVLVFAREAEGDVAPIRVLRVPDNIRLRIPGVFPAQNLLVVSGSPSQGERNNQLLIFDRRAQGDARPLRVIGGPRTTLGDDVGELRVYHDWIVVAHTVTGKAPADPSWPAVSVWSVHDEGDVPPRWSMNLGKIDGVSVDVKSFDLDPKNRAIVVATGRKPNNSVLTYSFPELFEGRD